MWEKIGNIITFKKFFEVVKKSCEGNSEMSSTRITSYIILVAIMSFVAYFLGTGIYILYTGKGVIIPNELIVIFASLLAHQLTLLGINKYNETKQIISENNKAGKPVQDVPIVPLEER